MGMLLVFALVIGISVMIAFTLVFFEEFLLASQFPRISLSLFLQLRDMFPNRWNMYDFHVEYYEHGYINRNQCFSFSLGETIIYHFHTRKLIEKDEKQKTADRFMAQWQDDVKEFIAEHLNEQEKDQLNRR